MFCQNCGKELNEGERFCPRCGTESGKSKKGVNLDIKVNEFLHEVDGIQRKIERLGESKIHYFAGILLQIISILFIGKDMFAVSYELFSTNYLHFTLFEDNEEMKHLFLIGYVAAAVMLLVPVLFSKEWKITHFILGMCMPIASVFWLVVAALRARGEVKSSGYYGLLEAVDIKIELSSNAWMLILVSISAVYLVYSEYRKLVQKLEEDCECFNGECEDAEGVYIPQGNPPIWVKIESSDRDLG